MPYEFLDHTADIGVRVTAPDARTLFSELALAFYALLLGETGPATVETAETVRIVLQAEDREALVVEFLAELIYRFDAERLLLPHVVVEELQLVGTHAHLRATLSGERFDPRRHPFHTEVKAATHHGLRFEQGEGQIAVSVIFDL